MSLLSAASALRELDGLERKKAELLFVLAILHAQHGYPRVAQAYAEECILLLRRIGTDSCEECATSVVCVGTVVLPEFLHEEVVRTRLKPWSVNV